MIFKSFARPEPGLQPADKVVGFDLGISACVTLIISGFVLLNTRASGVDSIARQHYVVGLFILLAAFLGALAFGTFVMHKYGYVDKDASKTKKPFVFGLNVGGGILLLVAFVLTGGSFK